MSTYKNEMMMYGFQELFHKKYGKIISKAGEIKPGASNRKIYRLSADGVSCIGIYNESVEENNAFISFSRSFLKAGINVPKIYEVSDDRKIYLEEDLGDVSLYSLMQESHPKGELMKYYERALHDLVKFQVKAKDVLDYSVCYETKTFDEKQIDFDLKKFREYYSQPFNVDIPGSLQDYVYGLIKKYILSADPDFFMFRDFQPRNIMLKDDKLYYIDYQSGRKGLLQYDAVSFILSSSISLTEDEKDYLINKYFEIASNYTPFDRDDFFTVYYYTALIRIMQMLGNYGYIYASRNDRHILLKIPKALDNLKYAGKFMPGSNDKLIQFTSILSKSPGILNLN